MKNCEGTVVFRYTLEGDKEKYACIKHAMQLRTIAELMGYQIHFDIVSDEESENLVCGGASNDTKIS